MCFHFIWSANLRSCTILTWSHNNIRKSTCVCTDTNYHTGVIETRVHILRTETKTSVSKWKKPTHNEYRLPLIHIIHELAMLCLIPRIQEVVYLYIVTTETCLISYVCASGATFSFSKCILSKLMEIDTSIYLFLMSGMNFSLKRSDYQTFSLVQYTSM